MSETFEFPDLSSNVDLLEELRRARAPFQAAYDVAYADWNKAMDTEGGADPMAAYKVLNLHYPWIEEWRGVKCMHCDSEWPCEPFQGLERPRA